jgi:hypothetical protein
MHTQGVQLGSVWLDTPVVSPPLLSHLMVVVLPAALKTEQLGFGMHTLASQSESLWLDTLVVSFPLLSPLMVVALPVPPVTRL